MDKVIRQNTETTSHTRQQSRAKKNRVWAILWTLVFSSAAVAASATAAWQGKDWGLPAFVLLIGVAIVSMLAVLAIIVAGLNSTGSQLAEPVIPVKTNDLASTVLTSSFLALRTPGLIVRDGRAVLANTAYMELARSLGVLVVEGEVPSVDSLFTKNEKAAAAAIFRLHHTSEVQGKTTETLRTLTEDGYRIFDISVSSFENTQLWQFEDKTNLDASQSFLLSEAPVGLFSVRADGGLLEMNDVLRGWLGLSSGETPDNIADFINNPDILLESSKTQGRIVRADTQLITQKGVNSPTMMSGVWHDMETGDIYASVAVYGHSGLGARSPSSLGAQTHLNEKRQVYTGTSSELDTLGEAPFGILQLSSTDLNSAIVTGANAAFTLMTGALVPIGAKDGLDFKSLFFDTPETTDFIEAGIYSEAGPMDVQLANGENISVNVYFSPNGEGDGVGGAVAYMIDISKRKELEDRLMQSQKMQAIGQLAGGVAHDFNNLLTVIRLNTDELLGRHPIGDPSYPELQQINQTVSRSASLVRKLLAFSRKQTMRVESLNVSDTLSDASVMLKRLMVERIDLKVVHGRGLPPMQADKNQFDNAMMNLCVNARDAMVEKGDGGGRITLTSSLATPADYEQDDIVQPQDGGFILIKVTDTGTGMDAKTQKKIFEPFFTTKEQGKGTGLGLATVYGIVEQFGGHLHVESTLGVGTTFRVYIPTAKAGENAEQGSVASKTKAKSVAKPVEVKPADLAGQGRILFVEDEDAVRAIAAKTLRKRGYTVIEACDGEEAYEFLEDGEEFDLMISDVVMPGMDGPTLLKKGRVMLGDTKIVFISGYAEEEFSELLAEEPDVTFLPKPFTLTQLAEKVKQVIGEAS